MKAWNIIEFLKKKSNIIDLHIRYIYINIKYKKYISPFKKKLTYNFYLTTNILHPLFLFKYFLFPFLVMSP
jgi:hypothetical protein